MSDIFHLYFDRDKLMKQGRAYVESGHKALRAERQRDVDGTITFLESEHAAKLRVVHAGAPEHRGISNDAPVKPVPQRG